MRPRMAVGERCGLVSGFLKFNSPTGLLQANVQEEVDI